MSSDTSEAELEAFTVLGASVPGAIASATLFFIAGLVGIANLVYTRYPWYDVVIVACFFRTISYSCRAAYLGGTYKPALEGVFLAFVNSGYGASVATLCMTHAWWYKYKPAVVFSARIDSFMKKFSMVLAALIVCLGPCVGVIAAGMIYGAYDNPVLGYRGVRLRFAASYGLLSCNTSIVLITAITCVRTYVLPTKTLRALKYQKEIIGKNPRLIILLLFCGLLLLIRGATGVVALYDIKSFVWENDHFFYPLDTLPELITFFVICWPTLLARIANFWPRDPRGDEEEASSGMTPPQQSVLKPNQKTSDGFHKVILDSSSSLP